MIKLIELLSVRGVTDKFELGQINLIEGRNGSGKSTIINSIIGMYKGKATVKEGITILENTDGNTLRNEIGKLTNKGFALSTDMDLCTAGFFMGGTAITGINKSAEDKRKTISELLGIDRDAFFKEKGIDYNIKGLTGELKELKIREDAYTDSIIKAETDLDSLEVVIEPKEVIHTETVVGNQSELDSLHKNLLDDRLITEDVPSIKPKPEEIILTETTTKVGNQNELDKLHTELEVIKNDGIKKKDEIDNTEMKNIQQQCPTCHREYDDLDQAKLTARVSHEDLLEYLGAEKQLIGNKYKAKVEEINDFKFIADIVTKGNLELYDEYRSDLEMHNQSVTRSTNAESRNIDIQNEIDIINRKINEFKLTETTMGNIEEFNKYKDELSLYKVYESLKKQLEDSIESLTGDIKGLDGKSLEKKIKKYKLIEKEFVLSVGNQLKLGDLQIIFYEEYKSPNASGDSYKEVFNIQYKGKLYNEISGGERGVIDMLIAKLFIDKSDVIDFMVQDNAEVSKEALMNVYKEILKPSNIQLITTRISDSDLRVNTLTK